MAVIEITEANFETEVLKSDVPVLVDFWAVWCGPCQMQGPIIDELAEEVQGVKFGKLNVDENMGLAQKFRVMSIPTLMLFKDGQAAATVVGLQSKEAVKNLLESEMAYDVIIVGNGPAGLSAALYTSRANLKTLVIGKDDGALTKADKIENYFGMAEPISGCELVENTKRQAKTLGAELTEDEIFHISRNGGFRLEGRKGVYEAKTVLLATGTARKTANIPGFSKLEGRGVSYCAVCDAFFYRGRKVGVLGNEDYAIHELGQLLPVVGEAVILTNGKALTTAAPEGVAVIEKKLISVNGEEQLESVSFDDGETLALDGLFVALGSAGAAELARKIGAMTEGRNIKVDEEMATNVPGLYAAGDCTGGLLQISKAVGEGAKAAMSMIRFVRQQKNNSN